LRAGFAVLAAIRRSVRLMALGSADEAQYPDNYAHPGASEAGTLDAAHPE
jgi:hypothetical protein